MTVREFPTQFLPRGIATLHNLVVTVGGYLNAPHGDIACVFHRERVAVDCTLFVTSAFERDIEPEPERRRRLEGLRGFHLFYRFPKVDQ